MLTYYNEIDNIFETRREKKKIQNIRILHNTAQTSMLWPSQNILLLSNYYNRKSKIFAVTIFFLIYQYIEKNKIFCLKRTGDFNISHRGRSAKYNHKCRK